MEQGLGPSGEPATREEEWIKRYQDEAAKSARLMRIVKDTLWMAQRYADGRMTYAVEMYNAAARDARSLGIEASDAKDGMFDAQEWDIQK